MRIKHGTQVRFTLRTGDRVLETSVMDAEIVGGAITRCGIMYNRLSVSGGVSWWDPSTGYAIDKPNYTIELVNPDDELTDGQLCDCVACLATSDE